MKKHNCSCLSQFLLLPLLALSIVGCHEDPVTGDDNKKDPNKDKTWEEVIDPDGDGIGINPAYVPIDWDNDEATIVSHDAEKGDFTLDFGKNELPEIEEGSILTLDVDTGIFLRKVVSVTESDGKVMLKTEQARLDEVFYDTEFELVMGNYNPRDTAQQEPDRPWDDPFGAGYQDDGPAWSNATRMERPSKHVFYPKEIRLQDEDGNWYVASHKGTRIDADFDKTWEFDCSLFDKNGFSLSFDGSVTFGFGISLKMNFSTDDSWVELYDKYDNNELYLRFTVNPSFNAKANLTLKATGKLADEEFKAPIIPSLKLTKLVFMVGGIPVEAGLSLGLQGIGNTTVDFSGSITTGFDFDFSGQIGFEYSQQRGMEFVGKKNVTFNYNPPTLSFSTTTDIKVGIAPNVELALYEVVGPRVRLLPYVDANIGAGALLDLTTANPAFGWHVDAGWGLESDCGIKAEVLSKKLFDVNSDPVTLQKKNTFFEAPSGIDIDSDPDRIDLKKWNKVEFEINDRLRALHTPTFIPVCVRFKASDDGKVKYEKDSAEEYDQLTTFSDAGGKAYVWWYPTKNDQELSAIIYDQFGKILSSKDVKIATVPSGISTIDMGTRVLWASANYGADTPEADGALVGWGDRNGTAKSQCFKKEYGQYEADKKKCYENYGGYDRTRGISGSSKDIVSKKWGGTWHIPTIDDWLELKESCDWKWENGGVYIHSPKTGNTLYLPAAGSRWGDEIQYKGDYGEYWAGNSYSQESGDDDRYGYYFYFERGGGKPNYHYTYRFVGQSIRPVRDR